MKIEARITKVRHYKAARKSVRYYSDGTKVTEYWQTTDEFCNEQGI